MLWRNSQKVNGSHYPSSYYLDLRKVTLDPEGLSSITWHLTEELYSKSYNISNIFVGGPYVGADPIIGAMVSRGFLVRKESKSTVNLAELLGLYEKACLVLW